MTDFINLIKQWMDTGVLPTVSAVATVFIVLCLELAGNKLKNKICKSEEDNAKLKAEVDELKNIIQDTKNTSDNSNEIVNCLIEIIHLAYANSKLSQDVKIQLQKLYDKCPDAITERVDVLEILSEKPTQAQIEEVTRTSEISYSDAIANKIKG